MSIMPAFERRPFEAMLIGKLLAGYDELEYLFAECLGSVVGDIHIGFRAYFRLRSESSRLEVVDALLRPAFTKVGLGNEYVQTLGALRQCLKIRNRYAHSHWADDENPGLFFTNLQEPADKADDFKLHVLHVDSDILTSQESYFEYARDCLRFIGTEYENRASKKSDHPFSMPKARVTPTPHNPEEEHVPQWLTQDQPEPGEDAPQ